MSAQEQMQLREQVNAVLEEEQTRMQVQVNMLKLTEKCWDACVSNKAATRLSSRDEQCLQNCVYRFFDTQVYVRERMFGQTQ
jgi:mitochondrial import inner membrane translocase subunit TIM8